MVLQLLKSGSIPLSLVISRLTCNHLAPRCHSNLSQLISMWRRKRLLYNSAVLVEPDDEVPFC